MPPRKSNPADVAERQTAFRERMAEANMVRREYWLPAQAVEDEAIIKRNQDPGRPVELITWVFAQQRRKIENGGGPKG